ncbi:Microsomal glutathione S-transferase 3 [Rhizophlyctis rosea]|uniref:Glutathione S-transferase 3, mitochondrial n=1 Tax=Rhizophlyctis rosea TaxID=64517 RepID=A0AAD5SMB7_9FUNG|nr:Microsomal glutathione S-transferase 3 [Rhizophlyctis rosea]
MVLTYTLTQDHGYVLAVAISAIFVTEILGGQVGGARKRAQVPYPYLYADKAEAEKDPKKKIFNCYQRAHQNTLEKLPGFLVLLAGASIEHPYLAAVSGAVWTVSRIAYAKGYQTGDPAKRQYGAFGYLGYFALLGASIKTAYNLIF